MLFTLNNGESVNVLGYDEYVKDFEVYINEGCLSDAHSMLVDYIEGLLTYARGSCGFTICKDRTCFYFSVREDDEHMIYYGGVRKFEW